MIENKLIDLSGFFIFRRFMNDAKVNIHSMNIKASVLRDFSVRREVDRDEIYNHYNELIRMAHTLNYDLNKFKSPLINKLFDDYTPVKKQYRKMVKKAKEEV